jgi:hypothetical protein
LNNFLESVVLFHGLSLAQSVGPLIQLSIIIDYINFIFGMARQLLLSSANIGDIKNKAGLSDENMEVPFV